MTARHHDVGAEGRFGEVSAALLLGGASRRMGRDKAGLPLDGVPAATRLARQLAELFEEVLLVGGSPPGDAPGRRVEDPPGPACALRGVVAALRAARGPRVLIVATDLYALTPDLLLALLAWPRGAAVAPRGERGFEPLCAVYEREVALPEAEARLAREELTVRDWLAALEPSGPGGADLAAVDPSGRALSNVNTPADLVALEQCDNGESS